MKPPAPRSRRNFLRTLGAGAAAAAFPGWMARAQEASPGRRRPNVILIMTDDQGAMDVNCYGAHTLVTPNMNALAERGTRFTQFYVGAPVCAPSRAALLTGRYPQRAGVPSNGPHLPLEQTTLAEVFRQAGYRTALVGKWHLGDSDETSPTRQGFEYFFGHRRGCIDNYSHFFYWNGPNRHDLWRNETEHFEPGEFFPDLMVREAGRFIEQHRNEPFFLYLPFNTPHYPIQPERRFDQLYAWADQPRRRYAAFVSSLDEKIGKVLEKLDELGLRDDTIVVFQSDNGHSVETRAFNGGGSAGPYRGHKFTLWEGGIRLPGIISWPGHIPEGAVRDQMVGAIDWLPTLCAYCGIDLPDHILDGRDISRVIADARAPSPHKAMHWQLGKQWAVHEGQWKLVADGPESQIDESLTIGAEEFFLSDLSRDPGERRNLASRNEQTVAHLRALHEAWAEDVARQ